MVKYGCINRSHFFLTILLVTSVARSATSADVAATVHAAALETLVDDILTHNPELAFYNAEIAAARGERRTAGAWSNPELSSTVGQKQVHDSGLSSEGLAWSVSVQQTFEWPGRIPLRKSIANKQIHLAELGLAEFRSSLAARARSLAYGLFASQEKAVAARAVADRFQQLRDVLVQRDPAGLTPQLETRIIEATALPMRRKATEADLEASSALLELNQLRGAQWTDALVVEPVALVFRPAPSQEQLLTAAQTNNFELQMRRVELEQQGFKVALARKNGYPAISVGPYFSQERAGDRERQVGVGISVPLPLWDRNQGNVEVAQARLTQARTTLTIAQRDLDRKVLQAALALVRHLQGKRGSDGSDRGPEKEIRGQLGGLRLDGLGDGSFLSLGLL